MRAIRQCCERFVANAREVFRSITIAPNRNLASGSGTGQLAYQPNDHLVRR